MEEIWKDIEGYEGIYQVSNLGQIKSLERTVNNGTGFRKVRERILKPVLNNYGYQLVCLRFSNGKQKSITIHRLVAFAFISIDKYRFQVNHKNGIKTDNRLENLEWCCHNENILHAIKKGLSNHKGSNNESSKLTENDVLAIRSSKLSNKELAKIYPVNRITIWSIKKRRIWKHI